MATQKIGITAVFDTSQFSSGLGKYIDGLKSANRETATISGSIETTSSKFGALGTAAGGAVAGIAAFTAALGGVAAAGVAVSIS